jgi:hypothetical protein
MKVLKNRGYQPHIYSSNDYPFGKFIQNPFNKAPASTSNVVNRDSEYLRKLVDMTAEVVKPIADVFNKIHPHVRHEYRDVRVGDFIRSGNDELDWDKYRNGVAKLEDKHRVAFTLMRKYGIACFVENDDEKLKAQQEKLEKDRKQKQEWTIQFNALQYAIQTAIIKGEVMENKEFESIYDKIIEDVISFLDERKL